MSSPDAELGSALRSFSEQVVETRIGVRNGRRFDVVVLAGPTQEELVAGIGLVRPGGHLYVELSSHGGARRLIGPSRSTGVVRTLGASGFADIRRYLHWPDPRSSTVILDLDEPASLQHFLNRRVGGWRGRALGRAGRLVTGLRLIERMAPGSSVMARRPD